MRFDSLLLAVAGGFGGMLGLAAMMTGVQGVAAVLCGLVLAIAATCLYTGWRFWTQSPLTRYRERRRVAFSSLREPHR